MTTPALLADLRRDEGLRLAAYRDSVGIWTVGYGHAHVAPGTVWTLDEAEAQLAADVAAACAALDARLAWWRALDDVRQDCLANQCFNLGAPTLATFTTYLGLVKAGAYAEAADDVLATKWARQVGERATRLAEQMRTGVHQGDAAAPEPAPAPGLASPEPVPPPAAVMPPLPPIAAPAPSPAPPRESGPKPVTDLEALIALVVVAAGLVAALAAWLVALMRRPKAAVPHPIPRAPSAETPVPRDPHTGAANMDFIQTVEADAAKALAEVKAGLTYLEHEGATIIAWVEKDAPSAAGAIATFLQGAEASAASLATLAANGLSNEISAGGDAMQTFLLNLIQASGFAANAQAGLKTIDASAVALIESIGKNLVSTSLAALLAKIAPAVAAAV